MYSILLSPVIFRLRLSGFHFHIRKDQQSVTLLSVCDPKSRHPGNRKTTTITISTPERDNGYDLTLGSSDLEFEDPSSLKFRSGRSHRS